jgi:hypothetical protein
MKNRLIGWITLGLLALGAISCQKPYTVKSTASKEVDLRGYTTYAWIAGQEAPKPGQPLYDNAYHRLLLIDAVEKELEKLGYQKDTINPDLSISFYLTFQDRRAVMPTGISTVPDFSMNGEVMVHEYTKGQLVIYIEDQRRGQPVWLSSIEGYLDRIPDEVDRKIRRAVGLLFNEYPYVAQPLPDRE